MGSAHDRYLASPSPCRRSLLETYHWSRCIELFNKKLSRPIRPQDRDAIWATAACLGISAIMAFEIPRPEEAWPLKRDDDSDLHWLRMSDGKMAVWRATDPLRPGSMFHAMSDEYARLFAPIPKSGISGIPPVLSLLCHLNGSSTAENNPYFAAVHCVSLLFGLSADKVTIPLGLSFMSHMQMAFRNLLEQKDPIALLVLAWWYTKARHICWWMEYRALVECQSICLYLLQNHGENAEIDRLLPWRPGRLGSDYVDIESLS
jgi:hypothetical protein